MSDTGYLESTRELVDRIKLGDTGARDRLVRRYLPILTRWAHGRLPTRSRDLNETSDLVQTALMRAFTNLPSFESVGHGAFFAYLRQVTINILKDEARRHRRRPLHGELGEEIEDRNAGPFEQTASIETLTAYEGAMRQLDEEQRELVVMRVELGMTHEEIAEVTASPTPNAARMRVARAIARLAELMAAQRS